jgi:hypothetical protein
MTASLARYLRPRTGAALLALFLQWLALPGRADELTDFHSAVAQASSQYRLAMTTLDTRGREETSVAVQRFREAWQVVIDRHAANHPAGSTDSDGYAGMFMQVDARIVGALIVIDIGSREAARDALAPIADTLSRLRTRSEPPSR